MVIKLALLGRVAQKGAPTEADAPSVLTRLGVNRGLSRSTFVPCGEFLPTHIRGGHSVFLSILEWPPFPFGQL
jgi:hypothetical protein